MDPSKKDKIQFHLCVSISLLIIICVILEYSKPKNEKSKFKKILMETKSELVNLEVDKEKEFDAKFDVIYEKVWKSTKVGHNFREGSKAYKGFNLGYF